jgi:hypothetical protein
MILLQGPPPLVGGGPPNPPPNFCQQFPDDPICIPVDSEIMFVVFLAIGMGIMLLTKKLDEKV